VQGFEAGAHTVPYLKRAETIASAISIANPLDGQKALDSIESTGGRAVAVTDLEILQAQYALSREEGLFVESSAAATVATLFKMSGLQGKRIVCALTGDGLKDPQALLQAAIRPATIKPEVGSFISLYRGSFFSGKTVSFVSRSEVVFTEAPSSEHLSRYVEDTFQVRYSPVQLEGIGSAIRRFLKRGKAVTFLDLQDIIQAQLEAVSVEKRRVLVVHDFEVSTGKDKKPHATVVAEVEGRSVTAAASGTGPVDAVISALKGVCEPADDFSLCGYRVTVRGDGTDAVVFVELKLVRGDQISSGGGTSPDIIQASIEAFENAYNGFFTAS
jgi:threonine synthase